MLADMSKAILGKYPKSSEVPCDANVLVIFLMYLVARDALTNRDVYRVPSVTGGADEMLESDMSMIEKQCPDTAHASRHCRASRSVSSRCAGSDGI